MKRKEAINHLSEWMDEKMWRCFGTIDREAIGMAIEALSDLEAEQGADRPTGEWVDKGGYNECSECGEVAQKVELCDCVYERLTNYCPNCGARMI